MTQEEKNKLAREKYQLNKEKKKLYYLENKEKINKYQKENELIIKEQKKLRYEKNKVEYINYSKKWRDNNKDIQKKYRILNKEKKKLYCLENKEKLNTNRKQYIKERRLKDENFRLTSNLRCLIRQSIKRNGYSKTSKTINILGCPYEQFKQYLESKFESWMNWDNYGKYNGEFNYGWDIDHKIPSSSAKTEDDIIRLNHYTNLQPLCSKVNRDIKKHNLIYSNIT